jgi:hypothetical protein
VFIDIIDSIGQIIYFSLNPIEPYRDLGKPLQAARYFTHRGIYGVQMPESSVPGRDQDLFGGPTRSTPNGVAQHSSHYD